MNESEILHLVIILKELYIQGFVNNLSKALKGTHQFKFNEDQK
jgi:hypothetical protein